jgi:hypothetical protein
MAPARRARSPNAQQHADDTDQESEPDTPRPQKLKKRLSEVYAADQDAGSANSDPGRPPLKAVNINDDAAEKRRRRKSTKINVIENAHAGPSSEGAHDQADGGETSRGAKQKQQLNTLAPPVINVSMDVMSSNFEEWMKMATDNVSSLNSHTAFDIENPAENQRLELMELCSDRLFSRYVAAQERRRQLDQFPTRVMHARRLRENLDEPCRQRRHRDRQAPQQSRVWRQRRRRRRR